GHLRPSLRGLQVLHFEHHRAVWVGDPRSARNELQAGKRILTFRGVTAANHHGNFLVRATKRQFTQARGLPPAGLHTSPSLLTVVGWPGLSLRSPGENPRIFDPPTGASKTQPRPPRQKSALAARGRERRPNEILYHSSMQLRISSRAVHIK